LRTIRRLSRLPFPHVQMMLSVDATSPAVLRKSLGDASDAAVAAAPACCWITTFRAKSKMTDETVVNMTWHHHDSQLTLCRDRFVSCSKGFELVSSELTASPPSSL
jgi:hypothetical protein